MNPKEVIIIGGGFAGIEAAKVLGGSSAHVTLIDRRNHHLFQPLLYQVAMAGLSPADIAIPIRSVLAPFKNVSVMLGQVETIDLEKNKVITNDRQLNYDYLILAAGTSQSYFGHEEWQEFAPGLKSVEEATEIRNRVLFAFEQAELLESAEAQKEWLTFVVVGGGPTGVELAGALGEISRYTLSKDFRKIDPNRTRVLLIEAGPRILPAFSERLAKRAARDLETLGVSVWTSTKVEDINKEGVQLKGEFIRARTVLWAAGVKASALSSTMNVPKDNIGRIVVESDCAIKSFPNVFVAGDLAHFEIKTNRLSSKTSESTRSVVLPGLAPVAIQQGKFIGELLRNEIEGKRALSSRPTFTYLDKGQMATVGRRRAIVQAHHLQFTGLFAWLMWLFVHVFFLIGFRNRVSVFLQWAWSYFTYKRGARLITSHDWRAR